MRNAVQGPVVSRRRRRGLLCAATLSLVAYSSLAIVAAQQHFFGLDHDARAWVQLFRGDDLNTPMRLVSLLGDNAGLIPLILVASLALWRVSRSWALLLPLLMAGTGALQYLAKWASDRPRPDLAPWGFPSGHVLSLVVFFGLIIYLIATATTPRRRWRLLGSTACLVPVVLVAFSRLYLEKHWLSDVVGGAIIGTAYLLLTIWLVELGAPAFCATRVTAARQWIARGRSIPLS